TTSVKLKSAPNRAKPSCILFPYHDPRRPLHGELFAMLTSYSLRAPGTNYPPKTSTAFTPGCSSTKAVTSSPAFSATLPPAPAVTTTPSTPAVMVAGPIRGPLVQKAIDAILKLGVLVTETAAVSNEHLFGLWVAIQHVLPPRGRHVDHALGLLHEHEVSGCATTGLQNLVV